MTRAISKTILRQLIVHLLSLSMTRAISKTIFETVNFAFVFVKYDKGNIEDYF